MGHSTKTLVALCLCVMVSTTMSMKQSSQKCQINRLTSSQPSIKVECERGLIEVWNDTQQQFKCNGIHATRVTIQQSSLSLPNFHPFPRLVYIQRGKGIFGITFPGCPETYDSSGTLERESDQEDLHQKVHRVTHGDIIAIPPGAVHWIYNDGNDDLITVIVNDFNNPSNQLDQYYNTFYLAGKMQHDFNNILVPFDTNLLSEAFDVPHSLITKMQETDNRGLVIKVNREEMRILSPQSEHDYNDERHNKYLLGLDVNGLEESVCTMRLRHNLDNHREADVYSRQGGRLNIVNEHKLPILRHLDMSVEKGNMFPNTIYSPHWAVNSHSVVYVTRGEAHVQVVGDNGKNVMDDRVNEGEMFVIPQYFTVLVKAGSNGFEYVSFKTTSNPMESPLVGYTSVLRAMPLQVLTNAYKISPLEAHQLKYNREQQTIFLPSKE